MQNKLTRRKFVQLTALAGAASTLPLSGCKKEVKVQPGDTDKEAIVIGSGFGGSVAALRLGQAGIKTTLLEMGKEYTVSPSKNVFCSTLQPDGRSTWLRQKTIRLS